MPFEMAKDMKVQGKTVSQDLVFKMVAEHSLVNTEAIYQIWRVCASLQSTLALQLKCDTDTSNS